MYFFTELPGKTLQDELEFILQETLIKLQLPAKMRYADDLVFVRPIRWFCVVLGDEPIKFTLLNIQSDNKTFGHRFMIEQKPITIKQASDYEKTLADNFVIVDFNKRKENILEQIKVLEKQNDFIVKIENALLDEVVSLVEYPIAVTGIFPEKFIELPKEVLITSMAIHQKYFYVENQQGRLINKFIAIANIKSEDAPQMIKGYEKVLIPRLNDAEFFIKKDINLGIKYFAQLLDKVSFFEELGTLAEKQQRINKLAQFINKHSKLNLKDELLQIATSFCKADLVSNLVYEFPELQGIAGRIYMLKEKFDEKAAYAIQESYKPKTEKDSCPDSLYGQVLAIADRIDTLVGLFGSGKIPTGEKDPLGLRRLAIGLLKLGANLYFELDKLIEQAYFGYTEQGYKLDQSILTKQLTVFCFDRYYYLYSEKYDRRIISAVISAKLLNLFYFSEQIETVAQIHKNKQIMLTINRVNNFFKKNESLKSSDIDTNLFEHPAEQQLYDLIDGYGDFFTDSSDKIDFNGYVTKLKLITVAVDNLFDNTIINATNNLLKKNRLILLSQAKIWFELFADFEKLKR